MLSHLVVISSFKFFSVPLSNRGPPLVLEKNGGRLNHFSFSLNPCGLHCKFSFSENMSSVCDDRCHKNGDELNSLTRFFLIAKKGVHIFFFFYIFESFVRDLYECKSKECF